MARQLIEELSDVNLDREVLYRGGIRHVKELRPVSFVPADQRRTWRRGGTYLITGGLGGIGFLIAEDLLRRFDARLLLTGRQFLPPETEWDSWLERHGSDDPISRRIHRLASLRAIGTVNYLEGDIADAAQGNAIGSWLRAHAPTWPIGWHHSRGEILDHEQMSLRAKTIASIDAVLAPRRGADGQSPNSLLSLRRKTCCSSPPSQRFPAH
ncbi:MAG: KR domain-containing protein [Planctomycetota bacterium]